MNRNYHSISLVSIDTDPGVAEEVSARQSRNRDPLELLIELEEELGCSIVEAVKRYRDIVREERTVNAH